MTLPEPGLRILAIEAFVTWHDHIDGVFVECLGKFGAVTLAAPKGYLASTWVERRIDIPAELLTEKTKIGARLNGMRILRHIRKTVQVDDFDAVVFLAYETISLALCWPKNERVFLFEHNNIDNTIGNRIKTFFYRLLGPKVTHLVFMDYIGRYIRESFGGRVFHIPLPVTALNSGNNDQSSERKGHAEGGAKVIFSPSNSTPASVQRDLMEFASNSGGRYYVVCRGGASEKTDAWETHPYFHDLEKRMRDCDMVFLGADFNYRVSAFAYEAMTYAKPFIAPNGPFVRELKKEYPDLVFPIGSLGEIASLKLDPEKAKMERDLFLEKQSVEVICAELGRLLKRGEN